MSIKQLSQNITSSATSQDVRGLAAYTGNLYEALAIISARSRQINRDIKLELNDKLEEFTESTETIEEVMENKEQIEISKTYERMANPALIATSEFKAGDLDWRYRDEEESQED